MLPKMVLGAVLGHFNGRYEPSNDLTQNELGGPMRDFISQSQFEVLNNAQPTFICADEGWRIIDLCISNPRLSLKVKESFMGTDMETPPKASKIVD